MVNGPITDTLSGRVAFKFSKEDGYLFNTLTQEKEEQEEDKIGRVTLLWKPNDQLTVRGKVEYSEYNRIGRNFLISEISGLPVNRPVRLANAVPIATPTDVGAAAQLSTYLFYDPRFTVGLDDTTSKQRESAHVISKGAVIDVGYDFGPILLKSITGWNTYSSNDQRDVDWSPSPYLYEPITQEFTQWTQELRVVSDIGEKFDYIAGLFYFNTDFFVNRRTDIDINLFFPDRQLNLATRKYANLRFLDQTAEMKSAYAQGTYHITPNLHLTGGLRWMTETKHAIDRLDNAAFGEPTRFLDPANNAADAALLALAISLGNTGLSTTRHSYNQQMTEENVTPEVKLSWDINDDMMVYASATKGYKGGGFNSNSNNQTSPTGQNDFSFRPEKTTAYEFGGKLRFPAARLNVNFAAFRQDIEDLQLSLWTGSGFFLTNAGAARLQGAEGDFIWQPIDGLRINGAVSLVDAKYTERVELGCNLSQLTFGDQTGCTILPTGGRIQDGNGKRFAPKYSAELGAQYTHPIFNDLELQYRADATFRAKGESAIDPSVVQPAYQLLDLSMTLRSTGPGTRWNAGVLVQNVFDKERYFYEFEAPAQSGTRIGFPAPPRRIVFRLGWDF